MTEIIVEPSNAVRRPLTRNELHRLASHTACAREIWRRMLCRAPFSALGNLC